MMVSWFCVNDITGAPYDPIVTVFPKPFKVLESSQSGYGFDDKSAPSDFRGASNS